MHSSLRLDLFDHNFWRRPGLPGWRELWQKHHHQQHQEAAWAAVPSSPWIVPSLRITLWSFILPISKGQKILSMKIQASHKLAISKPSYEAKESRNSPLLSLLRRGAHTPCLSTEQKVELPLPGQEDALSLFKQRERSYPMPTQVDPWPRTKVACSVTRCHSTPKTWGPAHTDTVLPMELNPQGEAHWLNSTPFPETSPR